MRAHSVARVLALLIAVTPALAQSGDSIVVQRSGSVPPSVGAAQNFTGNVRVGGRFKGSSPARVSGGTVIFDAGARTAWHTHPLGQTLIVTDGVGLVQLWGGAIQKIRLGDVVWIPPNTKHWHGATASSSMTHIAISEALDGKTVEWMEHVTDDQYKQ